MVRGKLQKVRDAFEEGEVDALEGEAAQFLRLDDVDPLGVRELLDALVIVLVLLDDRHAQHLAVHDHHRRSSCVTTPLRGLGGLSSFFLDQKRICYYVYLAIKAEEKVDAKRS